MDWIIILIIKLIIYLILEYHFKVKYQQYLLIYLDFPLLILIFNYKFNLNNIIINHELIKYSILYKLILVKMMVKIIIFQLVINYYSLFSIIIIMEVIFIMYYLLINLIIIFLITILIINYIQNQISYII